MGKQKLDFSAFSLQTTETTDACKSLLLNQRRKQNKKKQLPQKTSHSFFFFYLPDPESACNLKLNKRLTGGKTLFFFNPEEISAMIDQLQYRFSSQTFSPFHSSDSSDSHMEDPRSTSRQIYTSEQHQSFVEGIH